ncbi:MAG: enolase [bacterium]|nr:enolase [bacterium]
MIKFLKARQIFDSRKNPTVEVVLRTDKGVFCASCPSGASTGRNEAAVLESEIAIKNINQIISPRLIGQNELNQKEIDNFLIKLDGTKNKRNLGANAILPVSMAVCRAGAKSAKLPLYKYISEICGGPFSAGFPKPCFNIINGGAHAANRLDVQEFMIIPQEKSFRENLKIGKVIFKRLKKKIKKTLGKDSIILGDEGGFAPKISDPESALILILDTFGKYEVKIGIDIAATQFYKNGKYILNKKKMGKEDLLEYYSGLAGKYPLVFIEDPYAETDSEGFEKITKEIGKKIAVIGDDFLTTNMERIKKARRNKACNGVIIKLNQIGTITETLEAVALAKEYGWKIIVSHRSGETVDDFIADLAVGIGADYIKSGAPSKPERLAKYKRLVRIEKELRR